MRREVIYEKGLPNTVYEEMRKYLTIYDEAVSHICTLSLLNFLIMYTRKFFISVAEFQLIANAFFDRFMNFYEVFVQIFNRLMNFLGRRGKSADLHKYSFFSMFYCELLNSPISTRIFFQADKESYLNSVTPVVLQAKPLALLFYSHF